MVETYKNERGEIAVLVSDGYGAGWSTWNHYPEIAWDKRVVELFMSLTAAEVAALAGLFGGSSGMDWVQRKMDEWGYTSIYWGGFDGCSIKWVPAGTAFRITEYDGAEHIEYRDTTEWVVF